MEIYLDNGATTKPLNSVVEAANLAIKEQWHNPSALYRSAGLVENKIHSARRFICNIAGVKNAVFTSGGTESNNIAVNSAKRSRGKQHFICSKVEHSSVYETVKLLSEAGYEVDFIEPDRDYRVSAKNVANAMKPNTVFISIMHVNSETGAINDIAAIARAVKNINPRVVFHSDGVQAFLKINNDTARWADMYSVSAHKIGGIKGTGALLLNGYTPKPLITGGGQENNIRAGTENTMGIFCFEAACMDYSRNMNDYISHMRTLRRKMTQGLSGIDGCVLNSPEDEYCAPHIINASFLGARGETMLHILEEKGIYVGVGSACSSKKGYSRVLAAQGFKDERLEGVVRISLCPYNTQRDIEITLNELNEAYKKLKIYRRR